MVGFLVLVGSVALRNVPSISSTDLRPSLVNTSPFLSLIGPSTCLYFPANFLVVSYSCFIFPWAETSSASLARLSVKFSLSVFMLFLTALFASAYYFWAAALAALVLLLFITPFFSFPTCTLLIMSAEIHSLFWHISFHVLVHVSFICYHWVSMFSSSRRYCRASYLLLIVSRNVSVTSLSLRTSTLYLVPVLLLFISLFFSFIFILTSNR